MKFGVELRELHFIQILQGNSFWAGEANATL